MRHDMNTSEEFVGKSIAEARALAARYGYTAGGFTYISGALCVIRFEKAA